LREFEANFKMLGEAARQLRASVAQKRGRGRPRSLPKEGRATSNAWRDKRKREKAAEWNAEIKARVQALDDQAKETVRVMFRVYRRILWATMESMCAPPSRDE